MNRVRAWLVVLCALAFAASARAQGTISFDSGYPKAGTSSGEIVVNGSVTPDCGWLFPGCTGTVVLTAWQDGSVSTTTNIAVSGLGAPYSYSGTIMGLQSCANYKVTAEIIVTDGCCNLATLRTEVIIVTAP